MEHGYNTVACRSGSFSWDLEKSISWTLAWETVMWQDLFRWKAAPVFHLCLSSHGKSPTVLQQG